MHQFKAVVQEASQWLCKNHRCSYVLTIGAAGTASLRHANNIMVLVVHI